MNIMIVKKLLKLSGAYIPRADRILARIDRQGRGLEIGAGIAPVAPRRNGFNVETLDCCTREELVEKYRFLGAEAEARIEEVDYVWHGESYADLTGREHAYDWVIASHVIEHSTDLLGFLLECDRLLKPGGVLALAIPDKRFCMDTFRPVSSLARVIDVHGNGDHRLHSKGETAEQQLYSVTRNDRIAWRRLPARLLPGKYRFSYSEEAAKQALRETPEQYRDLHSWCFTPYAFRILVEDLYRLGLSPLREIAFTPTPRLSWEFFIWLSRDGAGMPVSRLTALKRARRENH